MNDWDDMNDEIQRLDETRVLDASNIRGAAAGNQNALQQNLAMDQLPAIDAESKPLQESLVMTFGDQSRSQNENFQHQLVDINAAHPRAGLQNLSKLASVNITEFDWRYEK